MTEQRKSWILQAALIGASASVLAACQTTSPYVERRQADSAPPAQTPAPRATPYDSEGNPVNPPVAAPSGAVSSQPLPAPQPTYTPPPPPPPPPPPVYSPPPAPVYRQVTTGRVVDAQGPAVSYTVKSGDNLDAIARDMGVTRKVLADLNDLDAPYVIKPGQKLKGPAADAKAYVVQSGDTLSAIGRRFGVTVQALLDANEMESDTIRPNQQILLPKGFKDAGPQRVLVTPAVSTPVPAPVSPPAATQAATPTTRPNPPASTSTYPKPSELPASPAPASPAPAQTVTPRPAAPPVSTSGASGSQIQAAGRGKFIWPLRGRVLSQFGTEGMVQKDGIKIAAPVGTSVRAAAAGSVVYAGPYEDFGSLVLIDHGNSFYTAYAHLSRILVKPKDTVRQNQEIGESGNAPEAALYFEMRYQSSSMTKVEAFDPLLVLPAQ